MAKDFSNLKNQPKKVDDSKVEDTAKVDENLGKTSDSEDVSKAEAKEETKEEKNARIAEEKAKAKAKKEAEAKADADEEDDKDDSEDVYFVNKNNHNLHTMVGDFVSGLFVAKTDLEKETIRKTEDYTWGLVKEYSKEEYFDSIKK